MKNWFLTKYIKLKKYSNFLSSKCTCQYFGMLPTVKYGGYRNLSLYQISCFEVKRFLNKSTVTDRHASDLIRVQFFLFLARNIKNKNIIANIFFGQFFSTKKKYSYTSPVSTFIKLCLMKHKMVH